MTNREKAEKSIQSAAWLLRNKPVNCTPVERHFLLRDAWDAVRNQPKWLQPGLGLRYVLERASLPIAEEDLLLGRFEEHVPTPEEEDALQALWKTNWQENPVFYANGGHYTINTETILRDGLAGRLSAVQKRLQEETDEEKRQFLCGAEEIFAAMVGYVGRYGAAAEAAGKRELSALCRKLTRSAPETFREGLQLLTFVYNIYLIYAGAPVACLTLGRLDDLLLPLYTRDVAEGRLSEEEAGYLIDDFSAKMSFHLGRGEHQLGHFEPDYIQTGWTRNPVYESPGYIVIGGYSHRADHRKNPLTLLFAKHIHPELKNPVYVWRRTNADSPELLAVMAKKVMENASVLVYNDETVISAYRHIGVEERDALDYSVHPCNWADIGGGSVGLGSAGEPLPVLLMRVLEENRDAGSMEALLCAAEEAYGKLLHKSFAHSRARWTRQEGEKDFPTLTDCLTDGVVENGRKADRGGAKYPFVYTLLRNIGTATDMLAAVEQLVFREKRYTLSQLLDAAGEDFAASPELLAALRRTSKYGTDDALADALGTELMGRLLDVIDRETLDENGRRDIYPVNVTINDSNHLWDGAKLGATVDGRRRGAPLSENLCGTAGYGQGVTALLNSVSRLPFDRIHSGALNLRLSRSLFRDAEGEKRLIALMEAYFRAGGMQLQFSFTDTAELRAAQKDPDAYRDLLVRITGYSAVFVDMCSKAQEEFLRREELR